MGDLARRHKSQIRSVNANAAEANKQVRRLSMEIRDPGIDGSFGSLPLAVEMVAAREYICLRLRRSVVLCDSLWPLC
jgi:hypothetical protein